MARADADHTTNLSFLIRDPFVRAAFEAAERDGLAPLADPAVAGWRCCGGFRPRDRAGVTRTPRRGLDWLIFPAGRPPLTAFQTQNAPVSLLAPRGQHAIPA
jgi:hypothetical protein